MRYRFLKTNKLLLVSAVVLAVGLIAQLATLSHRKPSNGHYVASWRFAPQTLAEADKLADQIVVGQVASIRPGPPIMTKVQGEPGGMDRIPTEIVSMKVEKTMKGSPAQSVEVFRTGLSVDTELLNRPPPPMQKAPPKPAKGAIDPPATPVRLTPQEANRYKVEDDPGYQVGQRYLLFLTSGPEIAKGTKRVVAPEGRFFVGADNKLVPVVDRGLALQFRGKALDGALDDIKKIQAPGKLQPGVLQPVPQTPQMPRPGVPAPK